MGREDALSTLLAATYVPNPFGLHHMLGNVGEWVADCHISSIEGAPRDGTAWQEGDFS
ncbi:MAG: SUMF1/EgtB/PvdO family nonheme iron enzyme, partial [Alphaproteobacteria bacterium]|nr:SUMF1/EgtB/PvdO family nonheme iron enzyme [Alphaproteobacteria bacterium]